MVGTPGAGKRTLGRLLVQAAKTKGVSVDVYGSCLWGVRGTAAANALTARPEVRPYVDVTLHRRTAAQLPLPADPTGRRPRFDAVVLAVNLTVLQSYTQLQANIAALDPAFLLGRACVVATHGTCAAAHSHGGPAVRRCLQSKAPALTIARRRRMARTSATDGQWAHGRMRCSGESASLRRGH